MGQYYKTKEFDVNVKFNEYFYLNDIKNYEAIYLIKDKDYQKTIDKLNLKEITIFAKEDTINDNNPIYLNLKHLTNSKIIYLKDDLELLNDDNIKSFISAFRGIIICNIERIKYLKDLNLISDDYLLKDNKILKIDNYLVIEEIDI